MKLSIHSFSDVITNSSESIYVSATEKSIVMVKELINYFLQKAGSDKKADDLFTFELILDEALVERILENIDDMKELPLPKEALKLFDKDLKEKEREEIIRELVKEGKIDPDNYSCDYSRREDSLIITPKNGPEEELDLTARVRRIFDISAIMNG